MTGTPAVVYLRSKVRAALGRSTWMLGHEQWGYQAKLRNVVAKVVGKEVWTGCCSSDVIGHYVVIESMGIPMLTETGSGVIDSMTWGR